MDRDQAFGIVCEFVKSESLRKHMLAVEVLRDRLRAQVRRRRAEVGYYRAATRFRLGDPSDYRGTSDEG